MYAFITCIQFSSVIATYFLKCTGNCLVFITELRYFDSDVSLVSAELNLLIFVEF